MPMMYRGINQDLCALVCVCVCGWHYLTFIIKKSKVLMNSVSV